MKTILDALQLLKSEAGVMRGNPFASVLDTRRDCQRLIETRNRLRSATGTIKIPAPPLDPKTVWQRFESGGDNLGMLNALEFRTLCSADEFALQPRFVKALLAQPERLKRRLCLYCLANSYFYRWRSMEAPEDLERLLTSAIARHPRPNSFIKRWQTTSSLFSPRAANGLAEFVVSRQSDLEVVLKLQYVGPNTGLALQTRAKVAELAVARFREMELSSNEQTSLAYLEWMIKTVFTDTLLPGALYAAVSSLILSQSAERSEPFQQALRSFVQSSPRLGDPRLRQSAPHWRGMEPEAAQRFLSWLAKENILFFFNTILPPSDHNRRRAEFWLRYHRQIKDFQVAISEQDLWKMKANGTGVDLPLHSRVAQSSASAFLMEFQGYGTEFIIVEFSETGNAAYIYERAVFESKNVNLRTPYFQLTRHLRHDGRTDRILHQGNWELPTRQKLAELGIRP